MTVEQWVEVFRASGVTDQQMHTWHHQFEQRYPEHHQEFLEWLGLGPERIAEVRAGRD